MAWEMPNAWDLAWSGTENPGTEHGWQILHVVDQCDRFPSICRELKRIKAYGIRATANLYSIKPGAFLVPHTGGPNQMILQLGLVCEHGKAVLRVGNETRRFTNGELMMFEDAHEHELTMTSHHPVGDRAESMGNPGGGKRRVFERISLAVIMDMSSFEADLRRVAGVQSSDEDDDSDDFEDSDDMEL